MKYAALVLWDNKSPVLSVDFSPVTDALLAGGIFLDEIAVLPYDAPEMAVTTLMRMESECAGVFVIADSALVPSAREAVISACGKRGDSEYVFEAERCMFAVLPAGQRGGDIVKTEIVPRINARRKNSYLRIVMRTVGAPAEKISVALARAEEVAGGKLALHSSGKYGCGKIEAIYDAATPKMTADEVVRVLAEELSPYLYAMEDITPAERLVEALKLHRMKLSTAESFTGGGVGRAIVRIPGASKVFYEGLNTYDSAAKTDRLGVSAFTLKGKGAVSAEVAYEMAAGLIVQGNCDISIATTGAAGPDPDGASPVGLMYIAVGRKEQVRVFCHRVPGDRETITETAINLALFHALKAITEFKLPDTL